MIRQIVAFLATLSLGLMVGLALGGRVTRESLEVARKANEESWRAMADAELSQMMFKIAMARCLDKFPRPPGFEESK